MSTDKTSELLADVSIQDLMSEVQRRLDCTKKPDKRIILIGPPGTANNQHTEHCTPCHLRTTQPIPQPANLPQAY